MTNTSTCHVIHGSEIASQRTCVIVVDDCMLRMALSYLPGMFCNDVRFVAQTGFDVLDRIGTGFFVIVFVTARENCREESLCYPLTRYLLIPAIGPALDSPIRIARSSNNR